MTRLLALLFLQMIYHLRSLFIDHKRKQKLKFNSWNHIIQQQRKKNEKERKCKPTE